MRKSTRKIVENVADEIVAPVKLHAGHVKRALGIGAGAKDGYRNDAESIIELLYRRGQLIRGIVRDRFGNEKYSAQDRYTAGTDWGKWWGTVNATGRDSTNMDAVDGGRGDPLSGSKADAMGQRKRVAARLSSEDMTIVQMVCAEGWWPSEAVKRACGEHYRFATLPRLNEALDHLIEAMR